MQYSNPTLSKSEENSRLIICKNDKQAWLGEFPRHWKVLRIKNLLCEIDDRSETGLEELLSVSHYTGVTLKRESLENEDDNLTNAESLIGYKKVEVGDLVINIMLAWNGSLGISPYDGITSPAYCVYRCNSGHNPEYFGYLFSTDHFKSEFRRNSTGIIDSRLRLYSDEFFSIYSVVPPKKEQDEIVSHIKTQSEKINRFIQKKQRFIELLKERKQSIINHAVTKGIDDNVKMKKSPFGEIPEGWNVRRLKFLAKKVGDGLHGTPEYVNESDFKFINGNNLINGSIVTDEETNCVSEAEYLKYDLKFEDGTILYSINGTIGNMAIYKNEKVILGKSAAFIEPDRNKESIIASEYLYNFLKSTFAYNYFLDSTASTTIKNLSLFTLRNTPLIFPKSFSEQQKIITHIKTETKVIDIAITKAEREIELIKEYKEAMIAEMVMRKTKFN